jgi:hypothetical protein
MAQLATPDRSRASRSVRDLAVLPANSGATIARSLSAVTEEPGRPIETIYRYYSVASAPAGAGQHVAQDT